MYSYRMNGLNYSCDFNALWSEDFKYEDLSETSLILALGRIDDTDTVYFNGEMIGNTGEFPNDHSNRTDYMYWSHDRFYFIPTQFILPEEKNTIAVRVYDFGQHGGIYEGPSASYPRKRI